MAGQLRKDVELIFRGEDRASPTIKGVRTEVRQLTDAIRDQLAAAERGEGSIDDLARAYKALQSAQGDVGDITKLAVAYENLAEKHARQATAADEARQKEAALNAQLEASEGKSKRLIDQRDRAARSAATAAQKEAELAAELQRVGAALEAAGGDATNFERTQELVRQAALETARALRDAQQAVDGFSAAQGRGKAALAGQADLSRFNELAAGSGLPEAQIAFISGLENRIEALNAAMRENAASAAAMNREIANNAAANAAARVRAFAGAMDEAEQSARRLEQATAFKSQAADIEARARDISRFGANSDTAAASTTRFADSIQRIIAPTAAASRTVEGLAEIVARSEGALDGSKRRISEYNDEINNLNQAQAGLLQLGGMVDSFRQQEAAVAGAQQALNAAQGDVLQYVAAIRQADQPTDEMARSLTQAEAALERAGAALTRESTKLKQLESSLESAGIDVRNLAAAEDSLTASANRAAAAQDTLRSKTGGRGSFLGLNPNEMQNLGFQINDIVVGLASGQRPLTVLVQQGAQIGQIIPGAFSAIVRFIPQLAVLGTVLLTVGGAIGSAADQARRLRQGRSIVASMGGEENVGATAQQFAELAKALEKVGVEGAKVREVLVQLSADGLDAGQMRQYIETARDISRVTGQEVPEAIGTLREAFQGGVEQIIELDNATNFLNDTELAHIQTLFEQGRADEARTEALNIYSQRMDEVARNSEGPWSRAVDRLSQAWSNFLNWMGNTRPFQAAISKMNDVAIAANYLAARLAGMSHEQAGREAVRGRAPTGNGPGRFFIDGPAAALRGVRRTNAGRVQQQEDERRLRAANATTAAQRRALAVENAREQAAGRRLSTLEITEAAARAGAIFDAEEARRQERRSGAAGRRAEAQRRREARAAAAAARQIESQEEQLQRSLEQLDASVANKQTESLERRLGAIDSQYARLFRQIDEYAERTGGRGLIGDRTIEQAREHVRLQQEQLRNYETMEFRERELNALLQERREKIDAIDDRVARGIISPEQGLQEADAVIANIAGRVETMARDAVTFAEGLRGAVPNAQLEAFIAKMQTAVQNNTGGQNVRESRERRTSAVDTAESGLNEIIQRRNQLVEHENLLVELGLQGRREAQQNIEQHYNRTSDLIRAQIQNIRGLAAAFQNDADPAMRLYFDNLIARLEAADIQADYVDARFTEMKSSIDNLLVSNIVSFIDSVAQAFAGLVTKKTDVLGFFGAIGLAFLDMIAKTLQGIAQLIIQMIVLDAIQKITGIPVRAMLQLYGSASIFHEGGVAGGTTNRKRNVSPLAFANAPRYHTGGLAGFAPDEVAAVVRRNEEILTEDDPRHRFNGGLNPQGGGLKSIRQLLLIGDDEIAGAMAGPAGEETVVTHIRRNKATIKQLLDN